MILTSPIQHKPFQHKESFHADIRRRLILAGLFISIFTGFSSAQAPVANFTGTPLSGCSPIIVVFTDLSTNNPTSWSWNFGNGSTSSLRNPTATYFNPGTYTVTLTATNASGSNTLVRTSYVTVFAQPTVNFTANDTAGCFPHTVNFTDLSNGGAGNSITTWEWDFGDGTLSNLQNPSHTYITSGNFTVTLKVTNDKGCVRTYSRPQYIRITPGVVVNFSDSYPITQCAPPINVTFNNTSTGPGVLTYSWDFGDGGTSTQQNPSHIYNSPGVYPVSLTVTSDQGCSNTLVQDTAVVIDTIIVDFSGPDSICLGQYVYLSNTSYPTPGSSYWDLGNGQFSTFPATPVLYTTAGTYQVKLRTVFPSGCIDSITKPIVVLPRPVSNFTADDTVQCQPPLTVNFQNTSVNGVSYQWNFGDGGTSTQQNPSHTYNALGDYTVTLITTNALGCKDTLVKPAYVKIRRPQISFPGFPIEGCVPFTINPVANIITFDTVTSYFWQFGDGNTSTLQNPTHVYPNQGTYTMTLTITTTNGCTETFTMGSAVKVGTRPTVNFIANPLTSCARQPIQFTDQSVPADQWIWHFGDGSTSTLQNPIHNYTDTGYFDVKLIAINNGCRDSITKPRYVYILPPVARFLTDINCGNRNTVTFTDNSVDPMTWLWDFGDGTTSTVQNPPPHTYAALGNYTVTLTVTNGQCTDTTIRTVQVINENPDVLGVPTAICKNSSVTLNAANINTQNVISYYWDFGDGNQLTNTVPTASNIYDSSGNYTVTLVTTDNNGCKDTIQKLNYIRINGPRANFDTLDGRGCVGFSAVFNDLTVTDGVNPIVSWKWDFGDGTIQTFTSPPFQHTYILPGVFSVKLTVTDAFGCVDSIQLNNIVTASDPFVSFITATPLTCPNTVVGFSPTVIANIESVLWDFGDGNTTNTLIPTHSYADTGWYTVKLIVNDVYGCSDSMVRNQYIRVDRPIANYIRDDSISSCIPFEVNFSNSSNFYIDQLWDFGDGGTSSLQNPTHYFTSPGVFDVELLITSPGGCKDSITKTITVYDTAGTRLAYSPLGGCIPQSVNLNVVTPSPATFIWDYGDGGSDTTMVPNISHLYTTYGNFVPKVILVDPSGCIIPVPGFDTVRIVGAIADFGANDSLLCDQGAINFTDSSTFNDPIINYTWDFGDGGSSNLQNPTHNYSAPGLYTVSMAIQTQSGCRDTATIIRYIQVVASPDTRIDGPAEICIYSPLQLYGNFNVPDTSIVTWQWNFANGNLSNLQNPPAQTYTASGNFTISSIAINSSGCVDTTFHDVRVHPLPTVSMPPEVTIIAGQSIQLPALYSGNMNSYLWSPPDDLDCPTCPTPTADPVRDRLYKTTFIDSNGCENIGTILVRVICKASNVFMPNTFSPNGDGNNDVFYPRGTGLNRARVLRVFNRWGEVIFERNDFAVNNPSLGWDGTYKGQKVDAGVYVYQVEIYCENGQFILFSGNVALIR